MNEPTRMNASIVNFAWALLVAVSLAEKEGIVTPLQQHMFIMRWLQNALKRKIFPKAISGELSWFIGQGRSLGYRAELREKALYLWTNGTKKNNNISDLQKATSLFSAMKMLGWRDKLMTDPEWDQLKTSTRSIPTFYVKRSAMEASFDSNEAMTVPVEIRVNKVFHGLDLLVEDAGLVLNINGEKNGLFCIMLRSQPVS